MRREETSPGPPFRLGSFFDPSEEALRSVLGLNLLGTISPFQVFGRQMAQQDEGMMLNYEEINSEEWAGREAEGILRVPHAGEMLYRVKP